MVLLPVGTMIYEVHLGTDMRWCCWDDSQYYQDKIHRAAQDGRGATVSRQRHEDASSSRRSTINRQDINGMVSRAHAKGVYIYFIFPSIFNQWLVFL